MKKILVALSMIALIGAGCAKTPAPASETTPTVSITATETLDQNNLESDNGDSVTTSVQVNPTPITSDEDVPVTDIFLGEPQEKYNMEAINFSFSPNVLTVKAGNAVQLTFTKVTGTHTFDIDETDSHYKITQGSNITFIAPSKPGSYKYYCGVGNHRQMGMEGTLIVK